MIRGLHHVQLAMPRGREEDARAFYAGVLGLVEVAKPAELRARGGCWFQADGLQVHLGVEEPFTAARKAHPALLVDDLDELERRLRSAAIDVVRDTELPGYRRFYAADPFGNRLEFLTPAEQA